METTKIFLLGRKTSLIILNITISIYILLFIYTGASKIFTFKEFDAALNVIPVFGPFHLIVSVLIISANIVIGILLIVPVTQRIGLYAAIALMIIFTVYLTFMVSFADKLPCSCSGIIEQLSWRNHIWLNLTLIFLAGLGISINQYKKQQL